MLPLPPVLPDLAWRFATRLGRDHHVRVETCDYSVHPRAIGRRVEVRVDLDSVVVTSPAMKSPATSVVGETPHDHRSRP